MTDGDRSTLQGLIEMHLGNIALQMTRRRLTTNPNESANRAFSASLPKNIKFSRNALGRVCSVIDRLNYGAGESMLWKLENPITKGGKMSRSVRRQVKGDLEMSGIVEIDNTTDAGLTRPQLDCPAHSHAASSSPLPDTTPLLASTPLSGLRKPHTEGSECMMLCDEIDNLHHEKEDLTAVSFSVEFRCH